MARTYEIRPDFLALILERCEERLLIAAFSDIEEMVDKQAWSRSFRFHFFESGLGVGLHYMSAINDARSCCIILSYRSRALNISPLKLLSDRDLNGLEAAAGTSARTSASSARNHFMRSLSVIFR